MTRRDNGPPLFLMVLRPVLLLALLHLLPALIAPPGLYAQDVTRPWVMVTVPLTEAGDSRSEVLATVIADNLELTLRLMGRYVVRPRPTARTTPEDAEQAAVFAREQTLDYLVFGRVGERAEVGATVFSLQVYSREDGQVTLEREAVAQAVLETFDVADELAADLLGAFTGQRIAYGAVVLRNLAEHPGGVRGVRGRGGCGAHGVCGGAGFGGRAHGGDRGP